MNLQAWRLPDHQDAGERRDANNWTRPERQGRFTDAARTDFTKQRIDSFSQGTAGRIARNFPDCFHLC
jgi:hypothetical protein